MSEVRSVALSGDLFGQRIREQWTEQLGRRLDVLHAGCAYQVPGLERVETRNTGVDEDLAPIRARLETRADLDAWMLGDLRSVPLPPRSFDVIHIAFLLERIQHTELVLDRMLNALRPGGLMLVRMRDRESAYGVCARITPSWLRRLLWPRLVAEGAVGPLPAVYEPITSRDGMQAYCLMRGLMITDDESATSGPARGRIGGAAVTLVDRLTRGRFPSGHDEVTMVIRKPQNHFARLI
ncbi:methyltransferase domain-containing protein [Nonomuraea sp. NPDC046570]|uniref:class I SAM-dependent methyltransferase n=1 Tax=Nonomuraea sp. NPDC046570 TaxID=3155255 RepID=UPI0033C46003